MDDVLAPPVPPTAQPHAVEDRGRLPLRRWELPTLIGIVTVFVGVAAYLVAQGSPLIWDEAVYALRARDFVAGDAPGAYWIAVRAPGLPLMITPLLALGAGDQMLRLGVLALATVGVGLTWVEGRLLFGRHVAPIVAALVALTPAWLVEGWQILPDVPGATLTMACVVLFTWATQGDRVRWWVMLVPAIAVAATVVRFGAPLLIGPALTMLALIRWQVVRRSLALVGGAGLSTIVGILAVLLVPPLTGKSQAPLSILFGRQTPKQVPFLDRLGALGDEIPVLLGGFVGGMILLGLVAAGIGLAKRQLPIAPVMGCVAVAVVTTVMLALGIAHHHVRYFAPVVPFLALGGASGLAWLAGVLPRRAAAALAVVIAVSGIGVTVGNASVEATPSDRDLARMTAATNLGNVAIAPCVLLTNNLNNAWYSGCESIMFPANRVRVNGQVRLTGIDDPHRILLTLERIAERAGAGDSRIYVVLSRPAARREPIRAARRTITRLAERVAISAPYGESASADIYDLGLANQLLNKTRRLLQQSG
jgi:hypothetical protein